MRDLSVIIPARNEMFLAKTVENVLENLRADTEVIAKPSSQWVNKRYFTGKPCRNGHVSERRVTDNRCVECVRQLHLKKGGGAWLKPTLQVRDKYEHSDKGQAAKLKYRKSAKRKAVALRYTKTPRGRAAAYRANHSDKYKVARKRYAQTEHGKACAVRNSAARRARKKQQAVQLYSFEDLQRRFATFDYQCAYCGSTEEITEDHVVPLARGGEHGLRNIVPCCRSCNVSKNAQDVEKWYRRQSFYTHERLCKVLESM